MGLLSLWAILYVSYEDLMSFIEMNTYFTAVVFDNIAQTHVGIPSLVKYRIRMDTDKVDNTKRIQSKWVFMACMTPLAWELLHDINWCTCTSAAIVFDAFDEHEVNLPTVVKYSIRMDTDKVDSTKRIMDR